MRAVLLAGLLLGSQASPPFSAAAARHSSDSLFVLELGAGAATVIVLHGGPGFGHQYLRPEWDRLARRYRVVYYDQRGCGRSNPHGPYGWKQHVADLDALVGTYDRHGPVVLAGSSWGGWLALLYALERPGRVKALVLSGTPPWPVVPTQPNLDLRRLRGQERWRDGLPPLVRQRSDELEAAQRAYADALAAWREAQQDSIEAGLLTVPRLDSLTSLRTANGLPRGVATRLGEGCPAVRAGVASSFRHGPGVAKLARVRAPALIVRGTRPTVQGDGADELVRILPTAALVTLRGAGHDPWFERPEQFFAHAERFLHRALHR